MDISASIFIFLVSFVFLINILLIVYVFLFWKITQPLTPLDMVFLGLPIGVVLLITGFILVNMNGTDLRSS